jgi:hypothetical protein
MDFLNLFLKFGKSFLDRIPDDVESCHEEPTRKSADYRIDFFQRCDEFQRYSGSAVLNAT